ncbi:MAG: hypothetical protein RMM08_10545 [Armatimonadota bacterium]|nr:hypothetical protein [bacterium]MDW8321791.1 hypothetical protein [Armatimonadota bacterium]
MSEGSHDSGGCLHCLGCLGMLLLFPVLWNIHPLLALVIAALYLGHYSSQPPAQEG